MCRSHVRNLTTALLFCLTVPTLAFAQNPPPPPPKQELTAEAAFIGTTGNTKTATFSAGAEHIARPDGWTIRNRALFVRASANSIVTANSVLYGFRAERAITTKVSGFGDFGYFRDQLAGVLHRNAVTGGLAFKIAETARHSFGADVGAGYLNEKRVIGADISTGTYSGGTLYKLKISETADLTDEVRLLGTFYNSDDWRASHAIALTAKLTTNMSLKVSNVVRFANFPPPGFKKTDTTTAVALVVSLKRP